MPKDWVPEGQRQEPPGRDELASIVEFVRAGDELVVVKLDRLGRSTRDVLNLVHDLEGRCQSNSDAFGGNVDHPISNFD